MDEQERQFEQQYFEQMQLDHELSQAADFLMRHGFMVIPKDEISRFVGNFALVPLPPVPDEVDPDNIPF